MSQEFTAKYQAFAPLSLERSEQAVTERLDDDAYWVCELRENGKVIGDLEYTKGEDGNYEIGYEFNEKYGKKGYATEACKSLIAHLFLTLNARRISADMDEPNVNSWRLMERLGFRREAHFIECEASFNEKDEQGNPIYVNYYVYALLKKEWRHDDN
jgi:RimJ/RimL family protein N-acetyltransferase